MKSNGFVSDIDKNIPVTNKVNTYRFALIIGNENYKNEITVKYAINDANSFKSYCTKMMGMPEENIHLIKNASYGQLLNELKWIQNVQKAYREKAEIIVYYAGHGMPDENSKGAYILPVDGNSTIKQSGISLDTIYNQLAYYPTKSTTIFLDACFSGAARNGNLTKGRGVKITPQIPKVKGSLIIMTASSGNETAFPYEKEQHGLFTYYLLKKMKSNNGFLSYGDLCEFVTTEVTQKSVVVNKKLQTPTITVGPMFESRWKDKIVF